VVVRDRWNLAKHSNQLRRIWFDRRSDRYAHESSSERLNSFGKSVVFSWEAGTDSISNYWIDVGNSAGGNNYYQSGSLPTTTTSATVSDLPLDGSEVYVTLYSLVNGQWLYNSYNFYAFSPASCVSTITSPAPGSWLALRSDTALMDRVAIRGARDLQARARRWRKEARQQETALDEEAFVLRRVRFEWGHGHRSVAFFLDLAVLLDDFVRLSAGP
jgi:hypothetical protein